MKKGERVIFFDFDGTIVDTKGIVYDVFMKIFDEFDYAFSKRHVRKHFGRRVNHIFGALGFIESKANHLTKKFYNTMIADASPEKLSLCASVKPLYDLRNKGYNFIIISNNNAKFIKKALKVLKIDDLFSYVYGEEDFVKKDEMLNELLKKYKIKPADSLYVGDRFSDIVMAHNVGIPAIAFHTKYGVSSKKELLRYEPDYIASNFSHVKEIVLGHSKK